MEVLVGTTIAPIFSNEEFCRLLIESGLLVLFDDTVKWFCESLGA